MNKIRSRNPWGWIPTLYFAEGLPNVAVTAVSLVMYKRLGLSNEEITIFTSFIALPWVIKPIWSPFVDLIRTKRWWTVLMQILMTACLGGVGYAITTSMFVSLSLMFFWALAFFSATHDIAADGYYMLELNPHLQSLYVGIRSTFYRLATIAGSGFFVMLAGGLETFSRDVKFSWSVTFYILAVVFALFTLYHYFRLPHPADDKPTAEVNARVLLSDFFGTFVTFFRKPQALAAVCFMLLYRLPEALLTKMSPLFLLDPPSKGGLGMSTQELGLATGTVGIIGLTIGGILGGIMAARYGLKKSLWPMVMLLTLPDLVYVYLSMMQEQNFAIISSCIFVEQFGYGFGFTAYMLYLIYYARGHAQTSHYAICTGIMALSLQIPGFIAGVLQKHVGYSHYFLIVMACCAVTYLVSAWIKIDPEFGKK